MLAAGGMPLFDTKLYIFHLKNKGSGTVSSVISTELSKALKCIGLSLASVEITEQREVDGWVLERHDESGTVAATSDNPPVKFTF